MELGLYAIHKGYQYPMSFMPDGAYVKLSSVNMFDLLRGFEIEKNSNGSILYKYVPFNELDAVFENRAYGNYGGYKFALHSLPSKQHAPQNQSVMLRTKSRQVALKFDFQESRQHTYEKIVPLDQLGDIEKITAPVEGFPVSPDLCAPSVLPPQTQKNYVGRRCYATVAGKQYSAIFYYNEILDIFSNDAKDLLENEFVYFPDLDDRFFKRIKLQEATNVYCLNTYGVYEDQIYEILEQEDDKFLLLPDRSISHILRLKTASSNVPSLQKVGWVPKDQVSDIVDLMQPITPSVKTIDTKYFVEAIYKGHTYIGTPCKNGSVLLLSENEEDMKHGFTDYGNRYAKFVDRNDLDDLYLLITCGIYKDDIFRVVMEQNGRVLLRTTRSGSSVQRLGFNFYNGGWQKWVSLNDMQRVWLKKVPIQ